jgi:hypothetical protein
VSTTSALVLIVAVAVVSACGAKTSSHGGAPAATGIRSIDWNNRTYVFPDREYVVANGEAEVLYDAMDNELSPAQWRRLHPGERPVARGTFAVAAPVYRDFDGDGTDDAVITMTTIGPGSGSYTAVAVFALRGDRVEVIAELPAS